MEQTGEYRIEAPAAKVWQALNDPDVLARSIDGCESMERTGDNAFKARVRARVGPVSAVFEGEVALSDIDPPRAYTLSGQVKGGPAGFGKGTAKVELVADGQATLLRYRVEGSVGGKLAQIGQRLIDAAARKMADDFFARFAGIVGPAPAEVPAAGPAPTRGFARSRLVWIAGAAILAAAAAVAALLQAR